MHVGFIRDATRWMQRLCVEQLAPPRRMGCADVERILGEPVRCCVPWVANWRNCVYRVDLGCGRVLVAKQACVPPTGSSRTNINSWPRFAG
jgi:hypothetical protein